MIVKLTGQIVTKTLSGLFFLSASLVTLWAAAALWFDFPVPALRPLLAPLYFIFIALVLWLSRGSRGAIALWTGTLLLIMAWWFTLKPTDNRNWQRDVDRVAWAEVLGNRARIYNIRNFDYATEKVYTPHWEDREVDIATIRGVDLFLSYWGSPWIAHGIASFSFADGTYLAASIEARKTVGQQYSAIRGFFRQYQVLYLIAEERDVIGVRTNKRGENVYLYHTLTSPEDARNLFREYLNWMNSARLRPEWYNALTRNCLSSFVRFLSAAKVGGISEWDWRTLLDGRADEMLYNLGDLDGDLPFPELKRRALIDTAARRTDLASNFSQEIRKQRPGF